MTFEIAGIKFVQATEKFDRSVENLFLPRNKLERGGMKFAVRGFGKSTSGKFQLIVNQNVRRDPRQPCVLEQDW
jgi:hypothetical protein